MTTTIPAAPRFRRWPRSGPTRRRAPCSPSGPSRMTTTVPASAALQALAAKWPDEATRALLAQRAVQDDNYAPRAPRFRRWPRSGPTRRRAPCSPSGPSRMTTSPRRAALQALAEKWPDEATRALLAQRAVQDDNHDPRSAALQALAEKWPDEATRALLAQRAVQDDNEDPRRAALQALAEKWPDEATRACSPSGPSRMTTSSPRSAALQALAEKWPDEATRALLAQRAVQDDNAITRRAALQALAAKWPDETTRALLAQRAVQDDNYGPRSAALQALAEKWPDEATRALLAQRAVQDDNDDPRSAALQALAAKWPDEATRDLLAQRAVQDPDDQVAVPAFSALGRMHSQFGRILPTRDLDGVGPYLDPLQPISRDHIEQAATKTGIRPDDIDAQVASLSAHLGWDVTRRAKPSAEEKVRRKRTRKGATRQ